MTDKRDILAGIVAERKGFTAHVHAAMLEAILQAWDQERNETQTERDHLAYKIGEALGALGQGQPFVAKAALEDAVRYLANGGQARRTNP